jgi:predicted ATP-grasp superfamily ATP-dependent carboligase/predicted phosphodiesterase
VIGVDRVVSLGDTVGYHANPRECLDWLRAEQIPGVIGNHDLVAAMLAEPDRFSERARRCILWTRRQLRPEHVRYFESLPREMTLGEEAVLCHATLWSVHDRVNTPQRVHRMFTTLHEERSPRRVCFFGHTHRPTVHRFDRGRVETLDELAVELNPACSYLVNPGSVGESRDSDHRASFVVYDDETRCVEFVRVPFDHRAARRKARDAHLPLAGRRRKFRLAPAARKRTIDRPPAVVLGLGANGLGVARALARMQVRVIGVFNDAGEVGRYSRHVRAVEFPDDQSEAEAYLERLLGLGEQFGDRPALIPSGDALVHLVSRHRAAVAERFRFHLPAHEVLHRLMDKSAALEAAQRYGIAVPRSFTVPAAVTRADFVGAVPLPCVAKPRLPWRRLDGLGKVTVLTTREEVGRLFDRYQRQVEDLVFQEMIEGSDADHAFCLCYVDSTGRVSGLSTGRSIHRYPPGLGVTASCVTERITELEQAGQRFLLGEGYRGLAELEFKRDRRDGVYKLFDVNTRPWAYNALAPACGVNLVHLAYLDAIGQRWTGAPIVGRPWRAWFNGEYELGYALRRLQHRRLDAIPWRAFSIRTTRAFFAWDDPRPAWSRIVWRLRKEWNRRARRAAVAGAPGSPGTAAGS